MKNQRFVQEFALLLLLAVAIGAIALQSNFNFTGFVVGPDGATCDGGWTCGEWTACVDSSQTRECIGVNSTNCISPITETQTCTMPDVCDATHLSLCLDEATCTTATGFWYNSICNAQAQVVDVCDATHLSLCLDEATCTTAMGAGFWYGTPAVCNAEAEVASSCDATHLSLCLDQTNCTTATGFWYNSICNAEAEVTCTENWECESWGSCNNGNKTRTCTDANSCGTTESKPSTSQSCSTASAIPTTTLISPATTTGAVTETPASTSCTPNWQCGDWQECVEGNQARVCADVNNCGTQEGSPTTSQTCIVPIVETCTDGLKNQDETRVDCGGVCKKCSIFTIVGSAISGPVDTGKNFVLKEMFGNSTKTIISIGSIVLVVGGLVCFKIFRKRKKK